MQRFFIQKVNQVALAHSRRVKSICTIQTNIRFQRLAAQRETCHSIDLRVSWAVQTFLSADDDKPMILLKTFWPRFPDVPLMNFHRSGACFVLAIALSNPMRSVCL